MSELTAFGSERIYWAVEQVERVTGDIDGLHLDDNLFYLKSEADKVIAHNKYKRCLAMAKWCKAEQDAAFLRYNWDSGRYVEVEFYERWYERWLEIAEKFKEV